MDADKQVDSMPHPIKQKNRYWIVGIVIMFLIGAFILGWYLAHHKDSNTTNMNTTKTQPQASTDTQNIDVKSVVRYSLPAGWSDMVCPPARNIVLILPTGASTSSCGSGKSTSAITISVESPTITDCNQLQGEQNVKKHVCISEYIDGHKSLKASTDYTKDSSYKEEVRVSTYYINTGSYVVKATYTDKLNNTADDYQAAFDQLATSIKVT